MGRRIIRQGQILGFSPLPATDPDDFSFPEDLFAPLTDRADTYLQRIEWGRLRMKNSLIAILGTARDIQEQVSRTIYTIESIGEMFKDYRVCIVESDSLDQTPQLLKKWKDENPRVHIISKKLGLPRLIDCSQDRMKVMATVRNMYHDYACEHFNHFPYFGVIDCDFRLGVSLDGIANTFGFAPWWDVMTANGMSNDCGYYDIAPLLFTGFEEKDVLIEQKLGATYANFKKGVIRPIYKRGELPIKCMSAFGGLAFYKREAFLNGRYANFLCDHATFHKELHEKEIRRIFINPSMILVR